MIRAQPVLELISDPQDTFRDIARFAEPSGFRVNVHASVRGFFSAYTSHGPACLVTDLHLADANCFDIQEELRRKDMVLPLIVITGAGSIRAAVQAIKAGIFDFLAKPVTDAALSASINAAIEHHAAVQHQRATRRELIERIGSLTRREIQVMAMVVDGMLNKQIASELRISPKTVEIHRANVMTKMQAEHVTDLVRMVITATAGVTSGNPRWAAMPSVRIAAPRTAVLSRS